MLQEGVPVTWIDWLNAHDASFDGYAAVCEGYDVAGLFNGLDCGDAGDG